MTFELDEINRQARTDPAAFIAQCDAVYWQNVKNAAAYIDKNAENAPIVLLSGPSGSGKTTTAHNIEKALGHKIERETLAGFDYTRAPQQKSSQPESAGHKQDRPAQPQKRSMQPKKHSTNPHQRRQGTHRDRTNEKKTTGS